MPDTESLTTIEMMLLNDSIAQALERAGLWQRAATCWLFIFDRLSTDYTREHIAFRREACLLMAYDNAAKATVYYRKPVVHEKFPCLSPLPAHRIRPSAHHTVSADLYPDNGKVGLCHAASTAAVHTTG